MTMIETNSIRLPALRRPVLTFVVGLVLGAGVASVSPSSLMLWREMFSTRGYGVTDWKIGVVP